MERTIIVCAEDEEDLLSKAGFAFWRMEIGAGETREENQGKRKTSWRCQQEDKYNIPSLVGF